LALQIRWNAISRICGSILGKIGKEHVERIKPKLVTGAPSLADRFLNPKKAVPSLSEVKRYDGHYEINLPFVVFLSLIVNLTLIALLIQKELISGAKGERAMRFSQALNVAIVPLLVAFFATMAFSIADLQR